jgi:hypothetical protein
MAGPAHWSATNFFGSPHCRSRPFTVVPLIRYIRSRYTHDFWIASPVRGEVDISTVSAHVDCSVGRAGFWMETDSGYDRNLRSPEGRSPERSEGEELVDCIVTLVKPFTTSLKDMKTNFANLAVRDPWQVSPQQN